MFSSKDLFFTPAVSTGYTVSKSLRFRSSATAYFNRTPAGAGTSNKIMTISAWVKRGSSTGTDQVMFGAYNAVNTDQFRFSSGDQLQVAFQDTGAGELLTTQVFRDYSAWYHLVLAIDTTQATASNRAKLYVNGVQVTAFATASYPAQNTAVNFSSNVACTIGRYTNSAVRYFDGYMAEINLIDGQALDPTSFGAYDTNGIWQPKAYVPTGTGYGTNGYYLKFTTVGATSGSNTGYGQDFSGNGNYWTTNNFGTTSTATTYDSMLDSPTNATGDIGNYAVLNPLKIISAVTLSNANLGITLSASTTLFQQAFGTIGVSSGKWYFEFVTASITGSGGGQFSVGVAKAEALNNVNNFTSGNAWLYYGVNGFKYNTSGSAYGATFGVNDVIGVAIDMDAGKIWFSKNNTWQASGDPVAGTNAAFTNLAGNTVVPILEDDQSNDTKVGGINFGQRPFAYTPPSGFSALNTQNLTTPTITNGAQYMAATTYTGTSSSNPISNATNNTTGTTFQPDFVWIKNRNYASGTNHVLIDSVRGASLGLASNLTNADFSTTGNFSSINNNGFTVTGTARDYNFLNDTFVGWQWNAGGAPTVDNSAGAGNVPTAGSVKINGSNSTSALAGSIAATRLSANTSAGFSVVTYTGTGANATVGHGLGVAPSMVIIKSRSAADWYVGHTSIGWSNTGYLILNNTGASGQYGSVAVWQSTAPNSTVITLGTASGVNAATTFVAYCFAPVAGYSAFGSYTGNGSADGPFVYLGFRPRWVMIKKTSAVDDWVILDTSRNTYNVVTNWLFPNLSNAELTAATSPDVLSNGFKLRSTSGGTNASGATFIYAAFAENPFNISRAR